MKYHAVGFGSNYWHQFGSVTHPLGTTAKADASEDDSSEGCSDQEQLISDAYMFPLHQDRSTSSYKAADTTTTTTTAAKSFKSSRSFNRLIRLTRAPRGSKKKHQKAKSGKNPTSLVDETNHRKGEMEFPFGYESNPIQYISSGAGHIVTVHPSGQIYMTGTLHGKTYLQPSLQPARIPLRCTQISCGRRHTLALFEGKGELVRVFACIYVISIGIGIAVGNRKGYLLRQVISANLTSCILQLYTFSHNVLG